MDFNEQMLQLSQRIKTLKTSIATEEATKTAMVMPFFQILGYDVFNPLEFTPEFIADVGIKKGEKVDYAIQIDEKPLIIIECKSCNENLDKHGSQLFRYFATTDCTKFAILTNGTNYRFYTDLENTNKMDDTPFLSVNLLDLNDRDLVELKKFSKEVLDIDAILNSASDLKYVRLVREWFSSELESPSTEFVKYIIGNIYDGVKNQKIIDRFTPIIKKALLQQINDTMNAKIKTALSKDDPEENGALNRLDNAQNEDIEEPPIKESKIDTTIEELESYAIIKAILRTVVDSERIVYRDTERYFSILLDNNNRKWICRVHLMQSTKYITVADENKNPVRYDIDRIDDIYNFSAEIIDSCKRYL